MLAHSSALQPIQTWAGSYMHRMTAQHRIAQYDTVLNARKSAISYTPSPSLVSFAVSSTGPSEVATDKITDEYLVAVRP